MKTNKSPLTIEICNTFTLKGEPELCDWVSIKRFMPSDFMRQNKPFSTDWNALNAAAFNFYNSIKKQIGVNGIVAIAQIKKGGKLNILRQSKSFK